MRKSAINLTKHQLDFASSPEYPMLKHQIMGQISLLLEETAEKLSLSPGIAAQNNWKISKGEQYQHMPWMALDCPRISTAKESFFTRTLFWWGHYFSFNLFVKPEQLTQSEILLSAPCLMIHGEQCWNNDINKDYVLGATVIREKIQNPYLRLVRTFPVHAYHQLSDARKVYENWMEELGLNA